MKVWHVNKAGRVLCVTRFLLLFFVSSPIFASGTYETVGTYSSATNALNACKSYWGGTQCGQLSGEDAFGIIWDFSSSSWLFIGNSLNENRTGYLFYFTVGCPVGTVEGEGGICEALPSCADKRGDSIGWQAGTSFSNTCVDGCTAVAYGSGFILADGTFTVNYKYNGGECDSGTGEEKAPAPCPANWTKDGGDVCRPDPGAEAPGEGEGKACEITKSGNCITFDPGVQFPGIPEGTEGLPESGPGTEGEETGAGGVVVGGGGGSASSGQSGTDLDGDGDTGSCNPGDPGCSQINAGTVQGGLTCDVAPQCDGDEVMCAMLMQQYLQRCPGVTFEAPQIGETDQKLADIKAEFETVWDDVKADAESYFNSSLSGGGSIPSRITSIFGVNVDFSLSRFLPYLAIIASLIVAVAWIIAAGIVLNRSG